MGIWGISLVRWHTSGTVVHPNPLVRWYTLVLVYLSQPKQKS